MTDVVQTPALTAEQERRRRPLRQWVISVERPAAGVELYRLEVSVIGSSPLLEKRTPVGVSTAIERLRAMVPEGSRKIPRRKDDEPSLVEAWV